jgi:DNA-binding response OmpR family regulator
VRTRILVVEEDLDIARLLGMILGAMGYESRTVANLEDARTFLGASPPPAIVLLDWRLPDHEPLAFCRAVKAAYPTVSVVVVTGHVQPEVRARALAAGCDHFLTKPFDVETVEAVVGLLLGDRSDRRLPASAAPLSALRRRREDRTELGSPAGPTAKSSPAAPRGALPRAS